MRLTSLEIRNFRSIEALRLDELDRPRIVLEGPNDVGKSNIVEALDIAFHALPNALLRALGKEQLRGWPDWPPGMQPRDLEACFRYQAREFSVGLDVRLLDGDLADGRRSPPAERASVLLRFTRGASGQWPDVVISALELVQHPLPDVEARLEFAEVASRSFRLVSTRRAPDDENYHPSQAKWEQDARWNGRNLKRLLFLYKNAADVEVQQRFELFRATLADPELAVGYVSVAIEANGMLRLRTRQNGTDLDIESRSSGVQQLVTLMALALCHRGRILAIEEPELNLSEKFQRAVWRKLGELTAAGGPLDQIFVTSHSRIFEEEAERIIVSRDGNGATLARWAEPRPAPAMADVETAPVLRGGSVTLSDSVRARLGIGDQGDSIYLVPDSHGGYRLLGSQGYLQLSATGGDDGEAN